MLPFYTHVLSEEEYGIADLVVNTANLLIPLISLSIAEAVVRFSLESKGYRKDAFSVGLLTIFGGFSVLLLCYPLMALNTKVLDYIWLIYLYVLMAALNAMIGQFARCVGYVKLFAYSGFQNTALLVIFNLTFLLGFHWGIVGYVLSTVLADFFTLLFIFWVGNLKHYVKLTGLRRDLAGMMYRFSIPLIPIPFAGGSSISPTGISSPIFWRTARRSTAFIPLPIRSRDLSSWPPPSLCRPGSCRR